MLNLFLFRLVFFLQGDNEVFKTRKILIAIQKEIVWILMLFLAFLYNILKNNKQSVDYGTKTRKMTGSSTDFLFGELLEAFLSLTESYSFNKSSDFASLVLETSSEIQTGEPEAHKRVAVSFFYKIF